MLKRTSILLPIVAVLAATVAPRAKGSDEQGLDESFANAGGDSDSPARCGNIVLGGRLQHFRAWLVEVDGNPIPHPPVKTGF